MSYDRRPYDDADTTGQMTIDAAACGDRLPRQRVRPEDVVRPAPSLAYDAAREVRKPEVEIGEAAAHLASRLHLG